MARRTAVCVAGEVRSATCRPQNGTLSPLHAPHLVLCAILQRSMRLFGQHGRLTNMHVEGLLRVELVRTGLYVS